MNSKEKIAALLAEATAKLAEAAKEAEASGEGVRWTSPDGRTVFFNEIKDEWSASNLNVEIGEYTWYNSSDMC